MEVLEVSPEGGASYKAGWGEHVTQKTKVRFAFCSKGLRTLPGYAKTASLALRKRRFVLCRFKQSLMGQKHCNEQVGHLRVSDAQQQPVYPCIL